MTGKDYYKILGVDKTADEAKIKKEFRKLARKYHPDVNPDNKEAETKFKEINEAYEVLGDSKKRKEYDTMGDSFFDNFQSKGSGFEGFNFNDFERSFGGFEEMFTGGCGKRSPTKAAPVRGENLKYVVEIDLKHVVTGKTLEVSFYHSIGCTYCNSTGEKPGSKSRTCSTCGGKGSVISSRGFFQTSQTCKACKGLGKVNVESCPSCNGQGETQKRETISVKIPPGVDTGSVVRVAGKGNAGKYGGPSGDMLIDIRVREKAKFKRDKQSLEIKAHIPFTDAILGGVLEMPTIDGKASMTIPPGTQNDQRFRLKGKGLPPLGGGPRGDQFVKIKVDIPKKIDMDTRELVEALAKKLKNNGDNSDSA